jgi:hypothetical protein
LLRYVCTLPFLLSGIHATHSLPWILVLLRFTPRYRSGSFSAPPSDARLASASPSDAHAAPAAPPVSAAAGAAAPCSPCCNPAGRASKRSGCRDGGWRSAFVAAADAFSACVHAGEDAVAMAALRPPACRPARSWLTLRQCDAERRPQKSGGWRGARAISDARRSTN